MKKYVLALFAVVFLAQPAFAQFKKEVIIFSQPCHYCDMLKKDLDVSIRAKHPGVKFTILDIREEENYERFMEYIKKHRLPRNNIGLPLIFVGDNHIMGWDEKASEELSQYINEM